MRPHASLSDIVAHRSDKEGEWIALVTRIEEAMCIMPFSPRQEDVITLLSMAVNGNQHMLRVEDLNGMVDALRAEVESLQDAHAIMKNVADGRQAEIEQLRAQVERLRHLIGVVLYREADPIAAAELIERARERSRAGQPRVTKHAE